VRIATAIAGALVLAAAAMVVVAFTSGGEGSRPAKAPATTTAPSAQADGLAVWVAQGCGSCHTLAAANSHGTFAPDLGASLAGTSAASIRRSIVDPGADAAAGYETGMMPDDFASRFTPRELDRLVAFLRASAR
jgi:mono/diheme cytochrome c family protein